MRGLHDLPQAFLAPEPKLLTSRLESLGSFRLDRDMSRTSTNKIQVGQQKGGCAPLRRAVGQLENAKSSEVFATAEHFCPKVEQRGASLGVNLGWGSGPVQPRLPLIPCPWGGG